jgi:hypothetical protein
MMGEIAVARVLGVEPDTSIHKSGDDGYDLVWRDSTWDVKTRGEPNKDLLIYPDMCDFRAKFCMLCWLMRPGVIGIVGYISRKNFKRLSELTGDGSRLYMRWQDLAQVMAREENGHSVLSGRRTNSLY